MSVCFDWQVNPTKSLEIERFYDLLQAIPKAIKFVNHGSLEIVLNVLQKEQLRVIEEAFQAFSFDYVDELKLNIGSSDAPVESLFFLAPKIRKLHLFCRDRSLRISKTTLSQITQFISKCSSQLHFVQISGICWRADDVFRLLSEGCIPNLSIGLYEVSLNQMSFGNSEAKMIAACLQKDCRIEKLELCSEGDLTPLLKLLPQFKALDSLTLRLHYDIIWNKDDTTLILSSCQSPKELIVIEDFHGKIFLEAINSSSMIESFEFRERSMDDIKFKEKPRMITTPQTLKRVRGSSFYFAVSSNTFVEEIDCLLDLELYSEIPFFSVCPHVKILKVGIIPSVDPDINIWHCSGFFQGLESNATLQSLSICGWKLKDEDLLCLLEALKSNVDLHTLELSICENQVKNVCEYLQSSAGGIEFLKLFSIQWRGNSTKEQAMLFQSLSLNNHIRSLILEDAYSLHVLEAVKCIEVNLNVINILYLFQTSEEEVERALMKNRARFQEECRFVLATRLFAAFSGKVVERAITWDILEMSAHLEN
jgi:hypothetical protein